MQMLVGLSVGWSVSKLHMKLIELIKVEVDEKYDVDEEDEDEVDEKECSREFSNLALELW